MCHFCYRARDNRLATFGGFDASIDGWDWCRCPLERGVDRSRAARKSASERNVLIVTPPSAMKATAV